MTTKLTSTATAAAFLATALVGTVAFAQGGGQAPAQQAPATPQRPMSGQGMMAPNGMDHGSMMDRAQMNRMMENCNRMMESKQDSRSGQGAKPDNG
jgi:periplasmic protein CpxP/Spy